MSDVTTGWRSAIPEALTYVREDEADDVARRLVSWWITQECVGDQNGWFRLALTRAEIVAVLNRMATSGSAPSRIQNPWNAQPNSRLVGLVLRLVDIIDQPQLASMPAPQGGVEIRKSAGARRVEKEAGLLQALADSKTFRPRLERGVVIPIDFNVDKLVETALAIDLRHKATRSKVPLLEELEYCVRLSHSRFVAQVVGARLGSSVVTEADQRFADRLREIRATRTRGANALVPAKENTGSGQRLVCLVVARDPGASGARAESSFVFKGDFKGAVARVEAVLGFGLQGMKFMMPKRGRRTTVLQEAVIIPSLAETGELEEDRQALRSALATAESVKRVVGGDNVVIGLGRVDVETPSYRVFWGLAQELKVILELWDKPKAERCKVREIKLRWTGKGGAPAEMNMPIQPHEKGRWRLSRRSKMTRGLQTTGCS